MDNPYLQQLKLERLAAQIIPLTAQLDKRKPYDITAVSAPVRTVRGGGLR